MCEGTVTGLRFRCETCSDYVCCARCSYLLPQEHPGHEFRSDYFCAESTIAAGGRNGFDAPTVPTEECPASASVSAPAEGERSRKRHKMLLSANARAHLRARSSSSSSSSSSVSQRTLSLPVLRQPTPEESESGISFAESHSSTESTEDPGYEILSTGNSGSSVAATFDLLH